MPKLNALLFSSLSLLLLSTGLLGAQNTPEDPTKLESQEKATALTQIEGQDCGLTTSAPSPVALENPFGSSFDQVLQTKSSSSCTSFHGNVSGCNGTPGCAYYYCSGRCFPQGTSNCDAGCSSYCGGTSCWQSHGDVLRCNNTPGCAYYVCSGQCHTRGTSNCDAGCESYCGDNNSCSAGHGSSSRCDGISGCAYYFCSNQCHPRGTSNCAAGCSGYC